MDYLEMIVLALTFLKESSFASVLIKLKHF
jgi:hypothetical protein